ncbi:MAG: NAD-dependent epimerase/dehydratase family protein [Candidatus Aminicenantia bacterium]
MDKIFLIGASGFIGNHVLRELLKNKYQVRVLIRGKSRRELLDGLEIEIFEGDIRDEESLIAGMRGFEAVFHCAGYYPKFSINTKIEVKRAIYETKNVMKASLKAGIKKMLYVSSMGTIWKDKDGIGRENAPFDFNKVRGVYHRIKMLMELLVRMYSKNKIELKIINPTFCVGEYETKPVQYCLIPRILKGMPFYIDGEMNAVDVKDVARGAILAFEGGKPDERYIIGGKNLKIKDFLEKIAEIGGVRAPHIKLPYWLAHLGGYLSEFLSYFIFKNYPRIPLSGIQMAKYGFFVSTEKAERELGFCPSPIEPAIERAIDWYKKIGYIR